MPGSAFIDLLNDVREQAREQIYDMALSVQDGMSGPDGSAFGDVVPAPADRIARFVDLASRGILDIMREDGSEPIYWRFIREFVEDMEKSPLMQPFPQQTTAGQPLDQLITDISAQIANGGQ